ncbi:MAG: hypothetical protein ACD_48C00040G0003 [uncultured bacterium]|uniref:Uncharacterized protein n=1 Tax=Candidatus Magasanikbacteria bacterium GW2011_GWE2_42_7 TaxID=1619052 RepID=A0A0G1BDF9_9BACT|nr:MAG: hypothetical protein ACD_48C00040G0003 [uncultured bacterium]KKS52167.1 MAG: hypothetical protein UV18_C0011G0045 [Candidatus Magasanikbacteria bacterium GW2011_GWC2_42_27]KKS71410.1 MAG: hypothetical protein UV42_C0029G0003 [Candidatus Magasanikbacteria bacterium GW2011_GWE2_42_7]KKT04581.1 MAG: hypothetical protein UV82_C0007G0081 [Candidatus Magasanikbacteria bacterium GW2011_GWD2_43_18]KKT25042.1 MAG: hypothetical protein UW10_C0015G0006 [Candidatus Magasanikbacteria bacterium GW201
MTKKTYLTIGFIVATLAFFVMPISHVFADRDEDEDEDIEWIREKQKQEYEDEYEDDDDYEDDYQVPVTPEIQIPQPVQISAPTQQYEVYYVTEYKKKNTYIVHDANNNGIVDEFETLIR